MNIKHDYSLKTNVFSLTIKREKKSNYNYNCFGQFFTWVFNQTQYNRSTRISRTETDPPLNPIPSFWGCVSVHINIVLYHVIMQGFCSYSGTSSVSPVQLSGRTALCSTPKNAVCACWRAVEHWADTECSRSGMHTHPVESQPDQRIHRMLVCVCVCVSEAFPGCSTTYLHASTCSMIIILPRSSCFFMIVGSQNWRRYPTSFPAIPVSHSVVIFYVMLINSLVVPCFTSRTSPGGLFSHRPKQWLPLAHRMVVFSGDTRPSPPATRSTSHCCCWSVKAHSLSSPCAAVERQTSCALSQKNK